MSTSLNRPVETNDYGVRTKEGKGKKVVQPGTKKKKKKPKGY